MGSQTSVPPKGAPGSAPQGNPIMSFVPMLVVVLILYVLIIRPQQKQAKEHKAMVDNLKSGDRVLTQGGIYGTVAGMKGNVVQVKIADNVRVDVSRASITQILTDATSPVSTPTGTPS
jgi:preprotein translocase subunit YajC